MAGILAHTQSGEVTISASTAKTILQLVAAANQRVLVRGFTVSFKGVSATDPPILVKLCRQTSAGTGGTATTIEKNDETDDETLATTGLYGCTGEPTTGNVVMTAEVHPQSGWQVYLPLGQEIVVKGGGRLGIVCTAGSTPSTVAVVGDILFEE